jgi:Integrase core domain.
MQWFHKTLAHPGVTRMYSTVSQHFTFPGIQSKIEAFARTCDTCQRTKLSLVDAGNLPPKDPEMNPWSQVQVDLVGPWKFNINPRLRITVEAFSAIDPFIGLCELSRIKNKTCAHISTIFHNVWISRYPTPLFCIHDNGPEFVAQEFQDVLSYYGIQDSPTTVKNPQANSIIERVHLTMESMIRTFIAEATENHRQILPADLDDFVDTALASTQRAINATVHSITKETPGAFIYQRDMMLPIQSFANWEIICHKKQAQISKNLLYENKDRRPCDWQPGMEVLVQDIHNKLDPKYKGPYVIQRMHTNGTVTIRKGHTFERLNIRRIKIYHRRENP